MKYISILLTATILIMSGCEPISFPEQPNVKDVVGDVLAFVSPDTVQQNTSFIVKLSFPNVCGGTFKQTLVSYDTLRHAFVQPIIHQVQQDACPAVYEVLTTSASLKFSSAGTYELVAIGNYGVLRKTIEVLPNTTANQEYRLQFRFQNRSGQVHIFQNSSFRFANQPDVFFNITTDDYGVWDSTFASTSTTLQYIIGDFQFQATRGITEDGIIIIP